MPPEEVVNGVGVITASPIVITDKNRAKRHVIRFIDSLAQFASYDEELILADSPPRWIHASYCFGAFFKTYNSAMSDLDKRLKK